METRSEINNEDQLGSVVDLLFQTFFSLSRFFFFSGSLIISPEA